MSCPQLQVRPQAMKLPVDVLSEVLDFLPEDEVHPFMSVSRLFYLASARRIYSSLVLFDLNQADGCLETLSLNLTLAGLVRKLCMYLPKPVSSAFETKLRSALLSVAPGIVELDLMIAEFDTSSHLPQIECPWLKNLSIRCPLGPSIVAFVRAQADHLEDLTLVVIDPPPPSSNESGLRGWDTEITMPALRRLTGPVDAMPIFLAKSPRVLELALEQQGDNIQVTTNEELASLLSMPFPLTSLALSGLPAQRFSAFSLVHQKFENLVKLKVTTSLEIAQSGAQFDLILPHLPNLRELVLYFRRQESSRLTSNFLNEEHVFVSHLSKLRESLCKCTLPSLTSWGRLKASGKWVPVVTTAEGIKWILDAALLLRPLQLNIFRTMTRLAAELENQDPAPGSDTQIQTVHRLASTSRKMALSIGYIINRAYSLPPASLPDEDPEAYLGPGLYMEQPQKTVLDLKGNERKPYEHFHCERAFAPELSDRTKWDVVFSTVGIAAVSAAEEIALEYQNEDFSVPAEPIIPVLEEWQKEAAGVVLDLMFNSSLGLTGIKVANYFRNPGDCWGKRHMVTTFNSAWAN